MKNQLVKAKTVKLAKEKGFQITERIITSYPEPIESNGSFNDLRGVSQSLLQKWLRDVHRLHIVIIPTVTCYWTYKIVDVQCDPENEIERPPYREVNGFDYNTYEEALEKALWASLNSIT